MSCTDPNEGHEPEDAVRQYGQDPRADECGRCNGTGEIGQGARLQTCPVCRGSTLSGEGEAKLIDEADKLLAASWSFLSRAPSDWSYVFGTQRFADEAAARECFEAAKRHAAENGGAGSLECGGRQVERFSIWSPND